MTKTGPQKEYHADDDEKDLIYFRLKLYLERCAHADEGCTVHHLQTILCPIALALSRILLLPSRLVKAYSDQQYR